MYKPLITTNIYYRPDLWQKAQFLDLPTYFISIEKEHGEGKCEHKFYRITISTVRSRVRRAKINNVTFVFNLGFSGPSRCVDLTFVGKKSSGQLVNFLFELKKVAVKIQDKKDTYDLIAHPSLNAKKYYQFPYRRLIVKE